MTEPLETRILRSTIAEKPASNRGYWSASAMAEHVGTRLSDVRRVWDAYGLDPRAARTWMLACDHEMLARAKGTAGLVVGRDHAVLVVCVGRRRPRLSEGVRVQIRRARERQAAVVCDGLLPVLEHVVRRGEDDLAEVKRSVLKQLFISVDRNAPPGSDVHVIVAGQCRDVGPVPWPSDNVRGWVHPVPCRDLWLQCAHRWLTAVPPWEADTVERGLWDWHADQRARARARWSWVAERGELTRRPAPPGPVKLGAADRERHRMGLVARRPPMLREALPRDVFALLAELLHRHHTAAGADDVGGLVTDDVRAGLALTADLLQTVPTIERQVLELLTGPGMPALTREIEARVGSTATIRRRIQLLRRVEAGKARQRVPKRTDPDGRPPALPSATDVQLAVEELLARRAELAQSRDDDTYQIATDDPLGAVAAVVARPHPVPPERQVELACCWDILRLARVQLWRFADSWSAVGRRLGMTNAEREACFGRLNPSAAAHAQKRRAQYLGRVHAAARSQVEKLSPRSNPAADVIFREAHELAVQLLERLPEPEDADDQDLADSISMLQDAVQEEDLLAGRIELLHYLSTNDTELRALDLFTEDEEFRSLVERASGLRARVREALAETPPPL